MDQERLWLGLSLALVPEDTLPSEKTVLRALHGLFENNMKKYREQSERICCYLLKETSNARCEVEKGCSETPSPCLLYQVMEISVIFSFKNALKLARAVFVSSISMVKKLWKIVNFAVISDWLNK